MSNYISGHRIIEEYKILPLELLPRFINEGLVPLNPHTGKPVSVKEILYALFGREDIDYTNDYINANSDIDWSQFQLPTSDAEISPGYESSHHTLNYQEISKFITDTLLDHIYHRHQYEQLVALDQAAKHGGDIHSVTNSNTKPKTADRTSTIHKKLLQRRAERIWEVYPDMHPTVLRTYPAFRRDIIKKNMKDYDEEFFKKSIIGKWPKPYKGPAKDTNIPSEVIEQIIQDL